AADQSVRETKNGIIITFSSVQYDKVLEWVLSRGGSARPLAPKVLVADWKRHIQMMAEKAKEGE
ncbi:MAG: DNA-binding protein, partial [Spirochaetales bacterium]|nr:DNA-binding protein [Spirochaetales bacterium]